MSFGSFLRKLSSESQDKSQEVNETEINRESSTINSLFAAPGKLLSSVNTKTGHLVSDLNQKLDLSGKLGTLKQVSVNKFESVVHGTTSPKEASNVSKDVSSPSPRAPLTNPFNDTVRSSSPMASVATAIKADADASATTLRRQHTNVSSKPPRPPPPTAVTLGRAMSLDETNISKRSTKMNKLDKLPPQLEPSSEFEEQASTRGRLERSNSCSRSRESERVGTSVGEDGDSSASEYGDHGDHPVYKSEDEGITNKQIQEPVQSVKNDEPTEHDAKSVMNVFVPAILNGRWSDVQDHDAQFHSLLGTAAGRLEFVNKMEQESLKTQGLLRPEALPSLLENIGHFLKHCQDSEDFGPARKLLTTSLLFYVSDQFSSNERTFLFTYIKTQPIWQTLRFWNACFFQSVQEARAKQLDQHTPVENPKEIIYDQLASYLNTMNVFDLHITIKQEFLRKQSNLFNLSDDEIQKLRSIIEERS